MSLPRILAINLAEDGVVVAYDDGSTAFYHQSIFYAHLQGTEAFEEVFAGDLDGYLNETSRDYKASGPAVIQRDNPAEF